MYLFSSVIIAGESGETILYQVRSVIVFSLIIYTLSRLLRKKLQEFLGSSILLVAAMYWSGIRLLFVEGSGNSCLWNHPMTTLENWF